ncbi:MAG TPA: hypothetical protein ENJ20_06560 [Bacteroidetes bacterium]|nr:hypothetical protein [Bacteroidota bacterium]
MNKLVLFIVLTTCIFIFTNCINENQRHTEADHLGTVHIHYNGSVEAMPYFEKGLKLLHNFEYDSACKNFLKARELDPSFVMACWGEAMTYNHPLWRQQDYDKGLAALGKLAATPEERMALAKTDLERDFLHGMEIMYGPKGNKKERDSLYAAHMEKMYRQYKGNDEVASFYALSLLGSVKVGRDVATYEKGAEVAKGILRHNPDHPGALHYLIHSYDDPEHAPMALSAAYSYSKVAADATHALHMPSHIFVSVGLWDEVVRSNIASWTASAEAAQKDTTSKSFGSYHALHWWMYGLLQQGRFDEARQLVADMYRYTTEKPTLSARGYLIAMKGNYLAETGEWTGEVAAFKTSAANLNIATQAREHFLNGMAAYSRQDAGALAGVIDTMEAARKKAAKLVSEEGIPMCSSGGANRQAPNQADLDHAQILELQLRSRLAQLNGKPQQTENLLRKAADLEARTSYSFGPPTIVVPSFEMYGRFLLEQGRPEEAAVQFDKALEKGPRRRLALQGRHLADQRINAMNGS